MCCLSMDQIRDIACSEADIYNSAGVVGLLSIESPQNCRHSSSSSSFGFFPSWVATADFPSPVVSINCIFLRHFNLSHVLFHHIHKPPFWPSPFPLSWQLHPQHPSPNIPIIFPPYVSIPSQSCLSSFLSKLSHLCCPSDVLIPDLVHSCHS